MNKKITIGVFLTASITVALFSFIFFLKPVFITEAADLGFPFSEPIQIQISSQTNKVFVLNRQTNEITIFDGKEKRAIASLPTGGKGSSAMTFDGLQRNLYILNQNSNNITSFLNLGLQDDFSQDSIKQILSERRSFIRTGALPVAFSGDGELRKLYVLNLKENTLRIIDRKTGETTTIRMGRDPDQIAVNQETHRAYVMNSGDSTLSIVDGETNGLIKTLSFGKPPFDLKISDDNKIFVSSGGDDKIYVVDGFKDELITSFESGGKGLRQIGINNSAKKLYVSNFFDHSLGVIDAQNYTLLKKISLPQGSRLSQFLVVEDDNLIFISDSGRNKVLIVNGLKDEIITELETGTFPLEPVINIQTKEVYISNFRSNSITVVSKTAEGQFQSQTIPDQKGIISTGKNFSLPFDLAINETAGEIYVLNQFVSNFAIIDTKTYKIKDKISVGTNPSEILFTSELNKVFVSVGDEDSIACYNLQDKSQKNILVGDKPIAMVFNHQTKKLYSLNFNSKDLSVIDVEKEINLANIFLGGTPPLGRREVPMQPNFQPIALSQKENKIYVADWENDQVIIINGGNDQILERVKVGSKPGNLLYDGTLNQLYVTNRLGNELTIIDGSSNQIKKNLTIGNFPGYLTLDELRKRVYVSSDPRIRVIDSDSLDIISCDIEASGYAAKTILDENNQKLFVLTGVENLLDIIDLKNNNRLASLPVFRLSSHLANLDLGRLEEAVFDSKTNKLFIALARADALAVVDTQKNRLEAVIHNEGVERISYPLPRNIRLILFSLVICVFIALIVAIGIKLKRKKSLSVSS